MKKIGWMWLAGLAFASSVQAQKIEEVLQSVEQNNKELQAVFHSTEAAKMEVQTQNNLEDPSVSTARSLPKELTEWPVRSW